MYNICSRNGLFCLLGYAIELNVSRNMFVMDKSNSRGTVDDLKTTHCAKEPEDYVINKLYRFPVMRNYAGTLEIIIPPLGGFSNLLADILFMKLII